MLIITFKSDIQQAEIGLYEDNEQLAHMSWQAHRELAETIHKKIIEVLTTADKRLHDLQGVAIFKGPGSFTGLRIGVSVANALAYSLDIPIAGGMGEQWTSDATEMLLAGQNEHTVVPEYGAEPNITKPKH